MLTKYNKPIYAYKTNLKLLTVNLKVCLFQWKRWIECDFYGLIILNYSECIIRKERHAFSKADMRSLAYPSYDWHELDMVCYL